jgi:hypothetical protein
MTSTAVQAAPTQYRVVDWQVPCKQVVLPPAAEQSAAQVWLWTQRRFEDPQVPQSQQGRPSLPHSEPPEPLDSTQPPPTPAIPPPPVAE